MSTSAEPNSHLASVRSGGCESFGAIGPSPFPSVPWQNRQYFWNVALPAAIDCGVEATGFLAGLAGAGACPALAPAANNTADKPRTQIMMAFDTRRFSATSRAAVNRG